MNILIVDDETDILEELKFYLGKLGFTSIVACSNPYEALQQASEISFDLAFFDIEMPGMNGIELADHISSLYPQISIVFLTAYNHYATEAFEVNAIDYILKPIRDDRLAKALDKLKRHRTSSENTFWTESEKDKFTIQMFGRFMIRKGDRVLKWDRKKSYELMAYLVENKEIPIHKEKLCDLLWPDIDVKKALMNLQTTMYSIRRMLKEERVSAISIDYANNHYTFHLQGLLTDADKFELLLENVSKQDDPALLKQALCLYTRDYLEEEGWLWTIPKKNLLRNKYRQALEGIRSMEK